MSLVGPRALPLKEQRFLEEQINSFGQRLLVRPGLTGMAQVYDITDDAQTKLNYDLAYIGSMNLMLDIKLIVISILNTLTSRWDRRSGKSNASHDG